MSDTPAFIPEGYEILRTVGTSGSGDEYVARYLPENTLVMLRVFNFTKTSGVTARRHHREYLRCDISFMEELEGPHIIRIFDYSDTRKLFWMATQPAEVDRLSKCFDILASEPFQFRQTLVRHFLDTLQWIHDNRVVHRNLSGDAVFWDSKSNIYIGDFGHAEYLTNQPATSRDTTFVTTMSYQPPEVRNAQTFTCDVSCDIFSAGMLAFEILCATALSKDNPDRINEIFCTSLNEQVAKGIIENDTAEVILKAVNPSPEKRWSTAKDFANALERSMQGQLAYGSVSLGATSAPDVTKPIASVETAPLQTASDMADKPSLPKRMPSEAAESITPLDPSHEIWNNHYEIIEKIGEGGQAVVYKAYDHLTNEEIAIKTIWSRHRTDRGAINRLKQGAMIARSLTHRYIIRTYSVEQRIDADDLSKFVFICMELIKSQLELGHVIEKRRAAGQKLRLNEVLHIVRQLLNALAYAHEYTIHRDIKPGNIMLVPHDEQAELDSSDLTKFDIRLIDFGIAKVLSQKHIDVTGKGFRSAHYGAPELADVKTGVDVRADIYSVGVMMYQMLTMNIPRKGSPPANKVNKEVPAALAKTIDKAINADREKRFKTIPEFAKEIDKAVSKFNWLRKAAKIAAVLLVGACIIGTVKYLLPQPDYGSVRQTVEILKDRIPVTEITTLAQGSVVTYSDIEGYEAYEGLRQAAIEKLEVVELAGSRQFNKRSFLPWKQQEETWTEMESAARKLQRIGQDHRQYNVRKDLAVASQLMQLAPSSEIVSDVRARADRAEKLLEARPFSRQTLDVCVDSLNLGARLYQNIEVLADGSDTQNTATQINDQARKVKQSRNDFLLVNSSLDTIKPLKDYGFDERRVKCLDKADRYYRSFELSSATKYLNLLNQICGTITYVKDRVDFKRSDIGLVASRLMDLCYEDVKTFDDYPEWKGRLEQVYKRKDFIAGYTSIQSVMSKCSAGAPLAVYDHAISARKLYERGDLDEAQDRLATTGKEYREFISRKITGFIHDCDSLFAFSSVRPESLQRCKNGLARLMDRVDEPAWPQADFADQYNRYSQQITDKKNAVREQLIRQASDLRKNIIDSSNKARQASFFWKSRLIGKYIAAAQRYDTDDVEGSIANWRYVENLNRLSSITNQMDNLNYRLAGMLTRKDQLDGLAGDIDEAVSFCERFKGVSDVERKKYNQWGLELKQLKSALSASTNNTRLIDQRDEIFAAEYSSIRSGFLEIRAQLPYHRSRVIELIKKSDYLKSNADSINKMQQHWTDVLPDLNVSLIKPNLTEARDYLEKVKDEVDKWSPDSFNRRMQDKCETLAGAIKEQSLAVLGVISAVLVEKDRLIDGIDSFDKKTAEVLADSDIRTLDDLAATDTRDALLRFRQLPDLLRTNRQRLVALGVDTGPVSANIITDTSPVGFELDTWLQKFNMEKDNLDAQIVQLRTIQDTTALFQEVQRILSQQSLMETDYYLGLRDCAVGLIDYSDISNRINAVETNSDSVKMCDFLEQMHNDTVPRLTDLKATVVSISEELASLKHSQIDTLSKAKGFNRDRERLLDHISALQQDVAKLSMANLENNCKESVAHSANEIMDLIGDTGQNDVLIRVTSSLWQFFPDHSNWSEWGPFLQLFHVAVSEEGMRLTCSDLLIPVNEEGSYLDPAGISGNIAKAFHLTVGESANFGWPRYVSHQKDPTVILAFIPGMQSVGVRPFYMATREINNTQYKLFLEENGAISTTKLAGWSYFADRYDKLLICQAQGQYPPCRISWDESTGFIITGVESRHAPVTWVTSDGAQAYAEWLGSRLPTASQHTFAARAGAGTVYPWGDDLSHITSYAHVRSATWQEAAREYNSKRDNPVEIAYPPVGAVKDFLRGKAIDPAKTVHAESVNYSVWPCSTKDTKPNLWGLYDMIGNVWEWCRDKPEGSAYVICGGSCLSPPEYTRSDSKYEFNAQACDVGFRVVMPVQ